MAWTAPRTWVVGEVVTAALMNTHLRDNMLETAPAKVSAAGDLLYATAANAIARLAIGSSGSTAGGGQWLGTSTAGLPGWAHGFAKMDSYSWLASTSQVTLTPTTNHTHLLVVGSWSLDSSGQGTNGNLQLGADTAANYFWQYLSAGAAVVSAGESLASTSLLSISPGGSTSGVAGNRLPGSGFAFVPFYKSSVTKGVYSGYLRVDSTATGGLSLVVVGGMWRSTAAVTQLRFFPSAGTVSPGSFTLYGLP